MNLKKVKKRLSTLLAVSMLCSSFNINLSRVQAEESSENVLITEEVIEQVPSEEKTEITIGTEIDQVEESLDSSNEELNSSDEKLSMIEIEGKQDVLTEEVRTVKAKQTIWIVGDSTVSYFTDEYYYPRYGWGTQIDKYFDSERFEVKNIALSGRSSKSFITEPEYQILLDGMNEGDYLFIGFGHNDEKTEAERYTNPNGDYTVTGSFANSLYENYIRLASEKGVTSVLMTPIVRRSASGDWTQSELHVTATSGEFEGGDYPQAVRDLGKDLNVAVVDLTSLTKSLYDELKPSETLNLHAWTSNKEASVDNTHTNIWGAHYNAYFIAKTIKQLNISGLSEYVLESAISSAPTKEEYLKSNPDYVAPSYDNNLEDSILWDDYGIFKGSVFGNVGGEPTTDNFTLETDADGNMHIAVKNDKGKIASAVDGLAMYYYKVPVGSTFTLTATAKVNSFKSNNQVSFGLMARDDMYVDKNIGDPIGDYVAAAPLNLTKPVGEVWNSFARKSGVLTQGGTMINEIKAGDSIELKLESNSDGYAATLGNEQTITGGFDFPLTSIDSEYVYVGMFVARNADVTFSNIKLVVDGKEVTGSTAGETVQSILNVSDLPVGDIASDLDLEEFTIKSGTTIDAHKKTSDEGIEFTQRLKLNGTGSKDSRSVHFSTDKEAELKLYALSASSSAERELGVYKADTNTLVTTIKVANENPLEAKYVTLTEAGDYYIASLASGVNVYYLDVTQTKGEVQRPAWESVISPVISSANVNDEDKALIDVAWEMVIGDAGADKLEIKLLDANDEVVDSKVVKKDSTSGVAQLTPNASGDYKILAEATRSGEEEVKLSTTFEFKNFIQPLQSFAITKVLTGENHSLNVEWESVEEAEYYQVAIKEDGTDTYQIITEKTTNTQLNIPNLTVGTKYVVKVSAIRGEDTVEATVTKVLKDAPEIWSVGQIGSNAAGTVTENEDGTVTISASNGKIADSEDGMTFYYTELPSTENFTLTATFKVDATTVSGKTYDGQSGFGVMAIDALELNNTNARYFNSAGAVFARYKHDVTTYNGIPGGRFVTGYEEGPTTPSIDRKLINTSVFDWDFNKENFNDPSKPHYQVGDVYTLTLRKSNTGYHAILNNETTNQVIYYDYDNELLTVQDEESIYVGMMASRGVAVTVSDIELTLISPADDEAPMERPVEYVTPKFSSDTTKTTADTNYELSVTSNVAGTYSIKDASGKTLYKDLPLESGQRILNKLTLATGDNQYKVEFTPSINQPTLTEYQELSSYDTMTLNVTISCNSFGTSENAIYVSTTGSQAGLGTKASPLDIYTAVAYAQPGQEIILLEGTYYLTEAITIDRGHDGTADEMITLMAEPGKRVVIDLSQSPKGGFTINADYWHFFGFEICNSQDNAKPLLIQGNHNIVEQLKVYKNGTTGVQISGSASEDKSMWPSYNLVQSVESYDNMDANANDADGFAAKITAGIGNIFRYCISHNNIDDGWDLYAKSTSGSIGQVVVESSIAYENGYLTTDPEKTVVGEGNGFKLGGESMPGNHILRNSISFNNYAKGVTSNSGPDVQVYNTVSFNNGGTNLSLYTSYKETNYKLDHFVSYNGGKVDDIKLTGQSSLASETNYLDGKNINGESVPSSWFENVDMKNYPTINEKGGFDFNGLETLLLESEEFLGIMATNKTEPTVITVGTEISSNGSTETPKPEEPVVPEKPNYIIPDSIKDAIDSTVIKPVTGTGVVNKPLILDITGASLSDVKSMFEKLSNFTVSVSMLKTRSNEVQYSVLLTSANESISLILTVDTNQSDVISYLNSFIKDTSKPDDSKPETPKPEENTNSTTQSSTTTNKPATGYTLMGWMTLGVFSTLLGFVSYIKRNKNDKKQVK
ncbi:hypothetical protein [Turicibacter sanguinis]|uniref:hypothetical protein n=1 Tax=Turicibacter sanguinis TaxID=154288 RepID=UPI0023312631|nr:hypothetical protein [Turicibacter sanguinis]MDB8458299.1 hypothetical protein [Turicibacter sanguinis]MDB8575188.1 hypothetical protein [Turicibacter sanguinis]MDB8577271.1 hypothetical protein [Turicibacter sanguinis]MDB8583815.1 hypothetical protein [Turicibacter sanguinis]MDB8586599.1 hypothetical protein [Turicibacter sanguinis]